MDGKVLEAALRPWVRFEAGLRGAPRLWTPKSKAKPCRHERPCNTPASLCRQENRQIKSLDFLHGPAVEKEAPLFFQAQPAQPSEAVVGAEVPLSCPLGHGPTKNALYS